MDYDLTHDTLTSLFCRRVKSDGPRQALLVPREGKFAGVTWDALAADVRAAAAMLARLGVKPGDRAMQVSENRYEWIVADLAILLARAIHVPVHASLTGPQIAYQIADSGAKVVLVSTSLQAAKLADQPGRDSWQVVCYDRPEGMHNVAWMQDLLQAHDLARTDQQGRDLEREALQKTQLNDLATILYTSGTTGEPKGVMLTHANLVHNAVATMQCFDISDGDLRLNWLPLSHIFARTCDLYCWIVGGYQLALAQSRETILANCQELSPTLLNGVPYFFDKVMRHLQETGQAETPGSLQKLLGGRIRFINSGGAALPDHVAAFFASLGVLLVQGYGLTETSPVMTLNTDRQYKHGTVGKTLPNVEVRIAGDGEVLTRGPQVMAGYWNKPQATAEAIVDGWLHTGDLGELDFDGYLKITGRKKELIVLASGKNIAPVYLESLLTEDPLIAQALVIGDGRNYLTALIVPNFETLKLEMTARGLAYTYPGECLEREDVRALFAGRVADRLKNVSTPEQVRKFWLLERPFTLESGELTPTLKLRRGVIGKRYAAEIDAMYASQES